MESDLQHQSLSIKSQKIQLMKIIEDLTLQLKVCRVERNQVQEARDIQVDYGHLLKELELTKRDLDLQVKHNKTKDSETRKISEQKMKLQAENDGLKKLITELDH